MAEKTEEAESNNPVFTFFKSMAQTVTQFPPSIIAETRVKICQLVAQMEAKLYMSKTRRQLRVFLFTIFLLHLIIRYPVITITVTFSQHPASHLLKCCPL